MKFPDPAYCFECGEADRTVYLVMHTAKGSVLLCIPCYIRPPGEPVRAEVMAYLAGEDDDAEAARSE